MTQNCSELPTTVEARPLNRPHQASKPAPPHSAKVKMTNVTIYADRKDVTKATDGGGEGSTGNASIQYICICTWPESGQSLESALAPSARDKASSAMRSGQGLERARAAADSCALRGCALHLGRAVADEAARQRARQKNC